MTFDEVLDQVRELLQNKGRVAYRALKRRVASRKPFANSSSNYILIG